MDDISSNLLIPIQNTNNTLSKLKNIEDGICNISDAICKMQSSISNLQRLRDKYLISLKQYQSDYHNLLGIYETIKEKFSSTSENYESNDLLNDHGSSNPPSAIFGQMNDESISANDHQQQIPSIQPQSYIPNRSLKKNSNKQPTSEENGHDTFLNPSPKTIISATTEGAQMSIDHINWQVTSNNVLVNNFNVKLRFALRTPAVICSVQFDPQGNCIAFSDGKLLHIISSENGALMYSLEIPKSSNKNDLHTRVIKFSPDGKLIAISSKSSSISIFSTETRKCIGNLEGHTKTVSSLLFLRGRSNIVPNVPQPSSNLNYNFEYNGYTNNYNYPNFNNPAFVSNPSNGQILISGSYDGLLCIWDLQTMSLTKVLHHGSETLGKLNDGAIVSLATDPEESFICVGFMKGTVGIYEPTFTQPLNSFVAHNEYLHSVKTVPCESAIVTTSHDKTAKIWALHTIASCKSVFSGHTDYVICSEIAPPDIVNNNKSKNKSKIKTKSKVQNMLMLTGSKDETLKGWNRETGEELFSISGHRNTIFEINHHPFEMSFVSCSGDGLICMWEYALPNA